MFVCLVERSLRVGIIWGGGVGLRGVCVTNAEEMGRKRVPSLLTDNVALLPRSS